MASVKTEDAEFLASEVRRISELATYSGFELAAYLLKVAEQEFLRHGRDCGESRAASG